MVRISSLIAFLIAPSYALLLSSSPTLDVSIVQYSLSVIVNSVVPIEVRVRTLLGLLLGSVRATSVYNGDALKGGYVLDN
jgi:hypothetical protein